MLGGLFALIGLLIVTIIKKDKELGKIESKKIAYTHIFLMIFTIVITSFSLKILIHMIFDFEATLKAIYLSGGFLSPRINTILWETITLLNVVILFSVFPLAHRSEKARKLFIRLLPIVYALSIFRSISDVMALRTPETPLGLVTALTIAGLSLTYLPIFFFYRNKNVQKAIFNNSETNKERVETIEKA